jgi:mannose/cellobiose epimerase-like protein (N-acyl-D-glucosamine 2-epimerase family)
MQEFALIEECKSWLRDAVLPLWTEQGVDPHSGAFVETLSFHAEPQKLARRAMVQARQIYSMVAAFELGLLPRARALSLVERAVEHLIERYSLPSGAFLQAVDVEGQPVSHEVDLYGQAFVLFGLANAYRLQPSPAVAERARRLLDYLRRERQLPAGGFSELKGGQTLFQSNPHMHLFEAALYWSEAQPDEPHWRALADELAGLAQSHFIDSASGWLAEQFDARWMPLRESGRFVTEPGHQYEWAWLFCRYDRLTGANTREMRHRLNELAERYGVHSGLAVDELWSDNSVRKASSRFWPQSERVKAALRLGLEYPQDRRFAAQADQGLQALKRYLSTAVPGLWQDTLLASGQFSVQEPKASSLYHIINAMSEYVQLRPQLIG